MFTAKNATLSTAPQIATTQPQDETFLQSLTFAVFAEFAAQDYKYEPGTLNYIEFDHSNKLCKSL